MITTKKTRTPDTTYECETCGTKSWSKERIENCEPSHTCTHENTYEYIESSDDCWWFQVKGITNICPKCKKTLAEVDFETIYHNQEVLGAVFELLKDQHDQA